MVEDLGPRGLLACQVAFKVLSDRMMTEQIKRQEPDQPLDRIHFRIQTSPYQLIMTLEASSLRDLLVDGDEPVGGEAPLAEVILLHCDKQGQQNTGWMRQIDISIVFAEGSNKALRLSLLDGSRYASALPQITRMIEYEDSQTGGQGYRGMKTRKFSNEEEVMFFIRLAKELFEKRDLA